VKFNKQLLLFCFLFGVVLICFGRTFSSFFTADDFGQVCYVSKIFEGNVKMLFSGFTGNYMQIPAMKVWRPFLLISLVYDYMIWRTNATGYFLTNVLFLAASAMMLYMVLFELTKSWGKKRSIMFSLFCACIFVSNPLHCESVSFVVGRVDIISAFFYLSALWCFVKRGADGNKVLLVTGVLSFWIAVLTKEMAIGAPALLLGIGFFIPEVLTRKTSDTTMFASAPTEYSLKERIRFAFQFSKPLWLSTVIYFCIRFLVLGTFTGGYIGSIGAGQLSHFVQKWTDIDTLFRIIFPLNSDVFAAGSHSKIALSILYFVLTALIFMKVLSSKYPAGWFGLLILWTLTAVIPLYQLWGLGFHLEGARFLFFLSIPLSIFIPLLILAPSRSSDNGSNVIRKIEALGVVATVLLIILSIEITSKNNIPWVHAGKETRACMQEAQKLASTVGTGERVVIIGIPKGHGGAHMIYNGITFNIMMLPPFSKVPYADKFITFDPILYGQAEQINAQRFKEVLGDPNVVGVFVWNEETLKFDLLTDKPQELVAKKQEGESVTFPFISTSILPFTEGRGVWSMQNNKIQVNDCPKGCGLMLSNFSLSPYQYDFVEMEVGTSLPSVSVSVFWKGNSSSDWYDLKFPAQKLSALTKFGKKIRIRLSNHWRWFTQGNIDKLRLELPAAQCIELKNIRLVSGKEILPLLSVVDMPSSNTGVYAVGSKGIQLLVDASAVAGCRVVKIEISKPNYFFENLPEESSEAVMKTIVHPSCEGKINIANDLFPMPGYYQLRALGMDEKGFPVGERSDVLTINLDNKHI